MRSITFATGNPKKAEEVQRILRPYGIEVDIARVRKIEVQDESIERIAAFSARMLSKRIGKPLIVEDTGLFIDALKGFPGPYSAYIYRTIGLAGILKLMEGIDNRGATFKCVVAYCEPGGRPIVFKGEVKGCIAYEVRGDAGWGYDPIFRPEGFSRTYAELGVYKDEVSHRAEAFREFARWYIGSKR
ncbi:MAG: XTP/dITP diphosphatase [Candidatus Bathyarchaeia archaeon]